MKKTLLACLLGAAFIAPAQAQSQAPGPYMGVAINSFDNTSTDSDYKVSLKLYGGYDFSDTWGVEGGVLGIPEYNASNQYGSVGKASANTFYVAGKASTPINDKLSLTTKLGLSYTRTNFDNEGTPDAQGGHHSSYGLYAGIGLKYALTEKVSLTLELERLGRQPTNISGGPRRESLSMGVNYRF
jgi:OOP family OmpA-OmpF porin